ncbi:MAG: exodeoxyribonuclease V subunit beta [Fodinibius sp.]|nr:exodeoxyribonuclease V subunit beta [Fodinibius sp.]
MRLLDPFEVSLSGINLVEASAGTGKTYNITSLYIRAIVEKDMAVSKLLVVTYTEAATKELKDRLLERIQQSIAVLKAGKVSDESDQFLVDLLDEVAQPEQAVDRLQRAVRLFDEASVYTIHGFCYQALQEQAFESRAMYDAEMIGDDSDLVQEAVDDYWRNWIAEVSEDPRKRPLLELLKDNNLGPEQLADELGSYIGKPYLQVLPEDNLSRKDIMQRLEELDELYSEMQEVWDQDRGDIIKLLLSDAPSGRKYRSDYLESWSGYMDEFLTADTPSLNPFKQFDNFALSTIADNLNKGYEEPPGHPFFNLVDEYLELLDSIRQFTVTFKTALLQYLRQKLNQKKEELQVLSYDDLLLRLRNALRDPERGGKLAAQLREKYPIAMVDEFQDTDPNQYDIFRSIYGGRQQAALFMIGDPKQSIYSFRGADVYSYLRARQDAPEENRFKLDRNFRSTPRLLEGLNAFWGGHDKPFVVDEIGYQDVSWGRKKETYDHFKINGVERSPICFRRLSQLGQDKKSKTPAAKQVAEDTANQIYRLLKGAAKGLVTIGDNAIKASDIAVLVRKHQQADLISQALQEKGIKSVQHSEQSVFESDEAEQLQQLLEAVADPANENLVKTALALPFTSYTANELVEIEDDSKTWTGLLEQFANWHRRWQEQGFAPMFRSVMADLQISEELISYPNGERRLTNMLHLGELLQDEAQREKGGPRSLLHWLARKRKDISQKNEEEQLRLESDENLVKVVTMHKSKGLQYPIVFCPFLWYGPHIQDKGQPLEYHHPDDNDTSYLDFDHLGSGRSEKRFYAQREELAESLRLAYVAMTRAEHGLFLSWNYAGASQFSSLGYLLQKPDQALQLLKAKVGYGDSVSWSADDMHENIEMLCEEHPELFTLEEIPNVEAGEQQEIGFASEEDTTPPLEARTFDRSTPLNNGYSLSSFSSLSSWMDEDDPDMPDYDQFITVDNMEEPSRAREQSMFTFPKGPQPGTCLHHIFEEIDFTTLDQKDTLIDESLGRHGIDRQWKAVVSEMLETVVHKPLYPVRNLQLAKLSSSDLVPEMEFYYQNGDIETTDLLSIIRPEASTGNKRGGAEAGFLKGFIDLTFRFDGKFYLLDYKSNYLGDSVANYEADQLIHEMQEASYDLQYHIYTIALHRFLQKRLPDYSYHDHFGGAFYLFLRGMNASGNEGIFFDKPDGSVINKLNSYIAGGKS